jgi:transmembrane sensor
MSGKQRDEDDAERMLGAASGMRGRFGPDDADDALLVEAADWLVRLMSRTATNDDAEQLAAWRAQSAAHDAAFREVAGVRSYAVVASSTKKPMSRRALLSAGGGGALALVAGLGLARPPLGLWPSYAELTADHRTPVGGRLAIRPTRGVEVELSSRTAVSLIDDGHGVRLIAGETYVEAAQQSRDFTVEAGRLRITARDAEFNVQALSSRERVACVRGELRCQVGDRSTTLAANQALSLSSDGSMQHSTVDAAKESAWRKGLLVFEGTPLAEVVDQINLHRSGRVVLTDSSLESVPLNAVFHIAQIENAVPQIEQLLNIRARHVAGGVVLLG